MLNTFEWPESNLEFCNIYRIIFSYINYLQLSGKMLIIPSGTLSVLDHFLHIDDTVQK